MANDLLAAHVGFVDVPAIVLVVLARHHVLISNWKANLKPSLISTEILRNGCSSIDKLKRLSQTATQKKFMLTKTSII